MSPLNRAFLLLAVALAACKKEPQDSINESVPHDDTTVESPPDDTVDTEVPAEVTSGQGFTAGGGLVRSDRYRMSVVVGGPSPAARVSSDRHQAVVGVAIPQLVH